MLFSLFLLAPLGDSEALPRWYPDGPSFKFFPYPVIDEERPWGGECEGCGGKCTGHYITDVDKLLQLNESAKTVRALPPSVLIEEAFKKQQANSNFQALAKKCCLAEEQVQLWWDHLHQNALNRARGAEKAKATRLRKKQQQQK